MRFPSTESRSTTNVSFRPKTRRRHRSRLHDKRLELVCRIDRSLAFWLTPLLPSKHSSPHSSGTLVFRVLATRSSYCTHLTCSLARPNLSASLQVESVRASGRSLVCGIAPRKVWPSRHAGGPRVARSLRDCRRGRVRASARAGAQQATETSPGRRVCYRRDCRGAIATSKLIGLHTECCLANLRRRHTKAAVKRQPVALLAEIADDN